MSDIIRKLLREEDPSIEIGFVEKYLGRGRYRVNMGGVLKTVRSAVRERIATGERVVMSNTENDRFIVGTTQQMQTRKESEIVVD